MGGSIPPSSALRLKQCTKCRDKKPTTEFHSNASKWDGLDNTCKVCKTRRNQRVYKLRKQYNLTEQQYEELYESQHGCCAICADELIEVGSNNFGVDHDHTTGKVRGILCRRCNQGLGQFRDNPKLLQEAIRYLENEGWKPDC